MEYCNGVWCVTAQELVANGVMTQSTYGHLTTRKQVRVLRRGGGGKGDCALVAMDSLPEKYKAKVKELWPNSRHMHLTAWINSQYRYDREAFDYYCGLRINGKPLDLSVVNEYTVNASVLNTCKTMYERASVCKRLMGERYKWDLMAETVNTLRQTYGHTLPESIGRFRKKAVEYFRGGYNVLVSGKYGNQSARKATDAVKQAVLSVACLENKPYNKNVWEMWQEFIYGELDVWDKDTGELLDPNDFTGRNGEPLELSETTINNILNQPANKLLINQAQLMHVTMMHEQLPHMHRHNGRYSLSQVTMDDVDLSRKLKDTKKWVHAYYAYDDVSECVIGASYAREKETPLVIDCFRDMFRLLDSHGWGMPRGIEVENHLMSQWRDSYLSPGVVFEFVRFCAPQNSQEKRAEHYNGAKKTSIIHKNHAFIGRPFSKGKRRVEQKKVSDGNNDTYEERRYYSYEELVADDRRDNEEWNHSLHSDQKRWPGKTRWEVLVENINPDLWPIDRRTLSRWIGVSVETSIRRNSTVRVNYCDWWLSGPEVLEKLQPNNLKVIAYYLPGENGEAKDVYIYQGDRFIDKVEKVETYCRVMAEQTEDDVAKFIEQQKKVSHFNKYLRDNAIAQVGVMEKKAAVAQQHTEQEDTTIPEVTEIPEETYQFKNEKDALIDL